MAIKPCRTCGGLDGTHYAFCFGARLFERVMGKGFPLFPPGTFTRKSIDVTGLLDVLKADGTLGEAQQAVRAAGADLDVTLVVPKEPDGALETLAKANERLQAKVQGDERRLYEERERSDALRRERDELQALVDTLTTPDAEPADEEVVPDRGGVLNEAAGPEPWWWNTPTGQEARSSVALDGETQSFPAEAASDPMPTVEQLASVPAEPAPVDVPVAGLDEAEVEALEEAAAELEAAQDPAEIQEIESKFSEAGRRQAWIDEKRAQLRAMINATEGLNQKALADGIGVNQGTVSAIMNGKSYGPTSEGYLKRMLAVAANFTTPAAEDMRPRSNNGGAEMLRSSEAWKAVERFLAEGTERAEDAEFVTAPDLQAAYNQWREATDSPAAHPMTLGQVTVGSGYTRIRKNVNGRQVRAYGGMRLKTLTPVARQGGGDEAPQDSDGEPVVGAPATPSRELLNPDAERYARDDIPQLFEEIHRQGMSVRSTMSAFLAQEATTTGVMEGAPDPATFLEKPRPLTIEHPAGWDDVPGKELRHMELRAMATKLVKEQGWGYKRSHGRQGKPKLRNPVGKTFSLPNTPGDYRAAKNTRAGLRRLGADL